MKTPKNHTGRLLKIADKAYPDRLIGQYFDMRKSLERDQSDPVRDAMSFGDTLALFIGREIMSVETPGDDFPEAGKRAAHALRVAICELERVINAIEREV